MRYITKEGDRWDWIAYEFYGDSNKYKEIIEANPQLPLGIVMSPILPAGIELEIPRIQVKEKTEDIPPWKR